jgi:4'-phosphopantetheinyl transferase
MVSRALDGRFVDVWFAWLEGSLETAAPFLSDDELERAARFHFDRDRNRFAVGRALLRQLLAEYTGFPAETIRFAYGPFGKPSLPDADITFNVSHSHERAVFAFSRGLEIGIDVEKINPRRSDREVAEQFFSALEVEELFALPAVDQERAFFTCWTRKEAFIKARGEGLNLPLQDFDVTLTPDASPKLRRTKWSRSEPDAWRLFDLSVGCPGYVAALAVRARDVGVFLRGDVAGVFESDRSVPLVSAKVAKVVPQT